jgi:protein-histidine pros-kinase
MARVAKDVSLGKMDAEEYVKSGSDEVATLSMSLNRLRRSIDEALKMLQTPKT